jgi:hypothetical protein
LRLLHSRLLSFFLSSSLTPSRFSSPTLSPPS